jgi:hypothetical protein
MPSPSANAVANPVRLPIVAVSSGLPSSRSRTAITSRNFPADGTRFSTIAALRFSAAASFRVPSAAQMSGGLGCTGISTRLAPRIASRASVSICGGVSITTTS